MFWVSLILSVIVFLTGIPPIRDWISSFLPRINQRYIDFIRIGLFLFFSIISAIGYVRLVNKISALENTIKESGNKIASTQEEVDNYKDFSSIAMLDMFGKPFEGTENQIQVTTSLSRKLEGFITKSGSNVYTVQEDNDALIRYREITATDPRFPFAHYYLALVLKKKNDPEWRQHAYEAQRIFRITTKLKDHHAAHDEALRNLNRMLEVN
jgi:hypothetical protein